MVAPSLRAYSKHAYQKTLCLPKTKFANRSNLQKTFDQLIPQSSQDVYREQFRIFLEKADKLSPLERQEFVQKQLFVLHDGPPYANGDLHLGHAMNKILKDIINRYQLLQGKFIFYKPGWDCHGLPIELKALQKLNKEESELFPTRIRKLASQHAQKTIKSQASQFKQFAIATDWDDCYETMQQQFELDQLDNLKIMIQKGLIKRQNKPVYWGTETKTALAEGELEYRDDHESMSAFIKFPLTEESSRVVAEWNKLRLDSPISLAIWTSTPWTIFANQAVCFNESFDYGLYELNNEYVVLESGLRSKVLPDIARLIATIPGTKLKDLKYYIPFLNKSPKPLIHGDHVTNISGTGLVHTAPGHGHDDYLIGVKNGLNIYSPVDDEGRYKIDMMPSHLREILMEPETGKARKVLSETTTSQILTMLQNHQMLLRAEKYIHSYPYDWRSKKPVIIRSTPQWFADLTDVKSLALESLKNVTFHPERGLNRLTSFIKSRNEWCISRQRSWGVPIPAFHKVGKSEEVLMSEEVAKYAISAIKRKGIDAWFKEDNSDINEWLPPSYQDRGHEYRRGRDTVDVWFDSGSTWKVIDRFYNHRLGLPLPRSPLADLYLEGSDQHRGWFQSSLLTKVATAGIPQAPYAAVLTHGFTLDENGSKMSKSLGNTILPSAVIAGDKDRGIPALGVDGLRLLIAQTDFTTDVSIGPTVIKHVAEALKKLRLTLKFMLGNLQKTAAGCELLPFEKLRDIDQYTLCKLQELSIQAKDHYDAYNFSKVLTAVLYHMNNQLSAFYFDVTKDALYSDSINSLKRQQIRTTLFHIFDTYRSILGPIIPVMIQEAWNCLDNEWKVLGLEQKSDLPAESPFTRPWKKLATLDSNSIIDGFEKNYLPLLRAYTKEFQALETVTKAAQTTATIYYSGETLPFCEESTADLLQVAELRSVKSDQRFGTTVELGGGLTVSLQVKPSELHECPRCWKHNSPSSESLCQRCSLVVT